MSAVTGEEIAVIGLACRFPGAPDVSTFWQNLVAGVDSIHDYTREELLDLGIGPGLLDDPAHVPAGGLLPGVEDFDAEFFGFGPGEAALTDPQHRLFLEASWTALEDAGYDPATYPGPVGVFGSASVNRYFQFHLFGNPAVSRADRDDWEGRLLERQAADYLPAQTAYRLGLTGPALAVQSACSGSLSAVCLAAQSLGDFRCDLALAGGVSVTWPRYRHTAGGLVARDGRCHAYDASGTGAGYGSGAGVVVLKRLADAEADGDHVHAVLRGWALSNDGAQRAGFAAPGLSGQTDAAAEALAVAEVEADEIGLVEGNGGGTVWGDTIEVQALTRAWRAAGARTTAACALGSVKTNIGHLDAASGVAGLIKAVLAVRHGVIPASLHFDKPNPETGLEDSPFFVPTETITWPADSPNPRLASVCAAGLGGSNAHVIVEQPPVRPAAERRPGPWPLPLSAASPQALAEQIARLRTYLTDHPDVDLADVSFTLAIGRRALRHRFAVVCEDVAEAIATLDPESDPNPEPGTVAELARQWMLGTDVDWRGVVSGRRIPLPGYPFQRVRHWIDLPEEIGATADQPGANA